MSQTFRAGLIGCGNIGAKYDERPDIHQIYTHAGMYRATTGLELVSACDQNAERLRAMQQHWGVARVYSDPAAMLAHEPLDMVSIATPDETHHDLILEALNHNRPRVIFCEKPLGQDAATVRRLIAACKAQHVELIVDYVRRWDDAHRQLRNLIWSGELGAIVAVTGYYVRGLRHNGCQIINLLRFLFGEASEVQALGDVTYGSFPGDPSIAFRLVLEQAPQAHVIPLDLNGYAYSIYEIDIFAEKGRVRILDGGMRFEFYPVIADVNFGNFMKLAAMQQLYPASYAKALLNAGSEFVAALSGAAACTTNTAIEAYRDQCVIDAIIASGRSGAVVAIAEEPY